MLSCQPRSTSTSNNNYRILLRRISKSLSTEEVNDMCYISQEAQSAGVQNKINFNGTVLFKFFEQRMLITDGNLDYLRELLQSIERIDLCKLIDDYMNSYLSGPFSSHSEPFAQLHSSEPLLQSSKLLSYIEPRPHSSHVVLQSDSLTYYSDAFTPTFCCSSMFSVFHTYIISFQTQRSISAMGNN